MRVLLAGVSCVGKTTIGTRLAELLTCPFVDLDNEIERFYGLPIEKLQERLPTMDSFRNEASKVLSQLLASPAKRECVIALPPSGLMGPYWKVVRRNEGTTVVLAAEPEDILERIRFYDVNSRPIEKRLTARERVAYLGEIRKDITYFGRSYRKADLSVDISGCNVEQAATRVQNALRAFWERTGS